LGLENTGRKGTANSRVARWGRRGQGIEDVYRRERPWGDALPNPTGEIKRCVLLGLSSRTTLSAGKPGLSKVGLKGARNRREGWDGKIQATYWVNGHGQDVSGRIILDPGLHQGSIATGHISFPSGVT